MNPVKVRTSDIFERFREAGILAGMTGKDVQVKGVTAADECGPGDLVFVDQESYAAIAVDRRPSAVVSRPEWAGKFGRMTFLAAPDVKLAQALITQEFFDRDPRDTGWPRIHPSATIHKSARVAKSATVGPGAVIGRRVRIGERCAVLANAVIEQDAEVGDDTIVHPSVVVGYGCRIGRHVILKAGAVIGSDGFGFAQDKNRKSHRVPQLGRVVIEDRVVIGANCCIDRATFRETRIGAGTIMDNLCHIAHNVVVGEDCILTAFLCVAGSSRLGRRVITSGQTGIVDHVEIADDTVLLHRAGVTSDVKKPGLYGGAPIQPLNEYMKNTAIAHRLSEMRAAVRALERR